MHSCCYIFLGSCSNGFFNLHTSSAPELFSRTEPAAAAAALTVGRLGLLMPSSTSLWRQLWAYSRLSSSASAWSVGNQAATTYHFGSQCQIMWDWNLSGKDAHESSWTLSTIHLNHSWKKSKQDCFACSMLPTLLAYVGITSWSKHVSSLPSFHTLLQWQPPKHHTLTSFQGVHNNTVAKKNKEWCTRYSSNAPLGGEGDFELTLWNQPIESVPWWLKVTSNGLALWWCQYHPICIASSSLGWACYFNKGPNL